MSPFPAMTPAGGGSARPLDLASAEEVVRDRMGKAAQLLQGQGLPRPALDGKTLRPLAAFITAPAARRLELDQRFWMGALAVEMVHEASLLHDDILDEAPERRGRPTLAASAGVGPALVLGDHLLTSAYRVALTARSPAFLELFVAAVERTVAGEIAQERSQGRILSEPEYRAIVTGKSGELFRAVFALTPALLATGDPARAGDLGARLGCFYQMVDDFLDYCPSADRGKPPLQDYRQSKWTWPLGLIEWRGFDVPDTEVLRRLFRRLPCGGPAPMEAGALRLAAEAAALLSDVEAEGLEPGLLAGLLGGWTGQCRIAAEREVVLRAAAPDLLSEGIAGGGGEGMIAGPGEGRRERRLDPVPGVGGDRSGAATPSPSRQRLEAALSSLAGERDWLAYFGRHGRSFRFAARLFPREASRRVAGVYAFCRFTDDLVDGPPSGDDPAALQSTLDTWLTLARRAHVGEASGIALLDEVVGGSGRAGVPFHFIHDLVEGVRMDVSPRTYRSLAELREYSYRVAGAVGGWLTELFGVHDPWVLERAFALGHAMQLTNILRDVGEDLNRGRLYLPLDRMARHGVDRELLQAMAAHRVPVFSGYRDLLEELMAEADADYQRALEAVPALPLFFRRPVAVAARVYQGIHDGIRRNAYDNLTRRAATSLPRKLWLGGSALLSLWRVASLATPDPRPLSFPSDGLGAEEGQEAAA